MRHKHIPVSIGSIAGDLIIEECKICKMRRIVSAHSTYKTRWVNEKDKKKYSLEIVWEEDKIK